MDESDRLGLILSNTSEIITKAELENLLESGKPLKAYAGYEPSGKIHLGHAISVYKLIELQRAGIEITVLLADLHAHLNGKGTLEEIRKTASYNQKCFISLGLDPGKTRFVLGSDIQLEKDYSLTVQKLALNTTLLRARRSMDVISRVKENPPVANALYPLMQVADMVALEVDIAVGGLDQRKIHMLARDNLPGIGEKPPVCIHLPIIHGLDGDEKMSSSKANFISIDDPPESIKSKIRSAFCPSNVAKDNPVLEMYRYHIFPIKSKVTIKRPEKFGGDAHYNSYIKLEEDFTNGQLHPADLKNNLSDELIERLSSARKYFEQ